MEFWKKLIKAVAKYNTIQNLEAATSQQLHEQWTDQSRYEENYGDKWKHMRVDVLLSGEAIIRLESDVSRYICVVVPAFVW